MSLSHRRTGGLGGAALALVVMALVMRVMAPPGFMLAAQGSSFPLVICTGHGALTLGEHGDPAAPGHKTVEAPCAFAGFATPPVPPPVAAIAAPMAIALLLDAPRRATHVAPGRGLAAPPPPSHAPPVLSI